MLLGTGVELGVAVAPSREAGGAKLHALKRDKVHNPNSSFLKFIWLLIMGNSGVVNH